MQRAVGLPPPPPRSEASSRSKVGALLASAKRARSHKHLVGSTPSLRSQSETRGAVSSSSTGALNSRLSRGRLTSTYVYFLLLEGSWLRCLGLATSVYGLAICVCSALAAPLTLCNVNREFEMDAGYHDETLQIELALRFAAAHVVTMSGGPVVPVTSVGYLTQVFQQLVGVAVNLLVLSAIVAKFQKPKADIVWSRKGVVRNRDGVPCLQLRLGNLRCNKLFPHEITLTLLRRHVTAEGEVYHNRHDLPVHKPSTVSGVFTVVHVIDAESPAFPLLKSGALFSSLGEHNVCHDEDATTSVGDDRGRNSHDNDEANDSEAREARDARETKPEEMLLHATLRAYDDVFKGDVCATMSYQTGSLVFGGVFADVLSVDADGAAKINWDRFDDVDSDRRCGGFPGLESRSFSETTLEGLTIETTPHGLVGTDFGLGTVTGGNAAEPISLPQENQPRLSCGCARASYGDVSDVGLDDTSEKSPLTPYCPYSSRLGLLLGEAQVEWELVKIDYVAGAPEWYKQQWPAGDAPAMQGSPGGSAADQSKWVGGSSVCRTNAINANDRVKQASELRSRHTELEITRLAETLIFGGLAPRVVGTREVRGLKLLNFMLKKTLGEFWDSREMTEEMIKQACADAMRDAIAKVGEMLRTCQENRGGGFLGGAEPDPSDFVIGGAVAVAKSLLESGLAYCESGRTSGFIDFGAESIDRYLERWTERKSWQKTYGAYGRVSTCNAAVVRSFAAKLVGAAPDTCPPSRVKSFCKRARELDAVYTQWRAERERREAKGDRLGHDTIGLTRTKQRGDAFASASICI